MQHTGGHGEGAGAGAYPRGVDPAGRRCWVGRGVAVLGRVPDDPRGEVLELDWIGRLHENCEKR